MTKESVFIILALVTLVCFIVWEAFNTRRKRLANIKANFGKIPDTRYKRTSIDKYSCEWQKNEPIKGYVDDITWNDLNMEDIYDIINVCQTNVGQDYLYALLRRPAEDKKQLDDRETLINAFNDENFRIKTQMLLARLGKRIGTNMPMLLFNTDSFSLQAKFKYVLFALSPLLAVPMLFANTQLALIWLFAMLGHNIYVFLATRKKLDSRLETISYFMSLISCSRRLVYETADVCPAYSKMLKKTLASFNKLGVSTAVLSTSAQSDAEVVIQMISMLTLIPVIQYCNVITKLNGLKPQMQMLYRLVGELDTDISLLSFRNSLELYTIPLFAENLSVKGKGIVHPLIRDAVPNDAEISTDWLLTGSNASGKSTFIKSVAVNNILAQTIHTCTAQSYTLKLAPVITSMAVEDNVIDGESYFIAEIKSMKRIIDMADAGVQCYCFIDEILKGTNTAERIAASSAVLEYLSGKDCICITATHDMELTRLLDGKYRNYHFSEQIDDNGVSFDYKLKCGVSKTRNAIQLLEYYDFPQEIISKARETAN